MEIKVTLTEEDVRKCKQVYQAFIAENSKSDMTFDEYLRITVYLGGQNRIIEEYQLYFG